ncbi:MAG: UvrD-helicase domain-containing protein [bacterium]|nr:UvrD-helicase domain-containing protein [bacterium]
MDSILEGLNNKQLEAVTAVEGPVLIIAGAGSGKTKALTHRVAHLISRGINPSSILAVTFTNKAADEMKTRIADLLKKHTAKESPKLFQKGTASPFVGTFHSLCVSILREECSKIKFQRNFSIFDEDDSLSLLKEIIKEFNISTKQYPPGMVRHTISNLKNELISDEEYSVTAGEEIFSKNVSKVYAEYQTRLKKANAFDFDDLITSVVRIFKENPDVLKKYQERFSYIHVDEFQDTNMPQYLLVSLLTKSRGNIFVIGDDAQSIYSWRGADMRNIYNFEKEWPNTKVILLEQNYRSTQTILGAANDLITNNPSQKKKNLWTENTAGEPITLISTESERHEAGLIAEEIIHSIENEKRKPNDFAVLYRTNAQSRSLEEALLDSSLPYVIIGGIKFFQRREVKDIVAYLRFLQNPSDSISLKRIINLPPRGIGRVAFLNYIGGVSGKNGRKEKIILEKFESLVEKLREELEKNNLSQFIKTLIKKINYREYLDDGSNEAEMRWENVQELVSLAKRFDNVPTKEGLVELLSDIALVSYDDADKTGPKEKISLMTLHAAKGLEFPVVFIAGLEEGIFPHSKSLLEPSSLEEERRLCYVGITRAKEKLYLLWAGRRTIFGEIQANIPSRFIKEIPEKYLEVSETRNTEQGGGEYEDESLIF